MSETCPQQTCHIHSQAQLRSSVSRGKGGGGLWGEMVRLGWGLGAGVHACCMREQGWWRVGARGGVAVPGQA